MTLVMNIDIAQIWVSQRGLRRAGQIPAMVKTLQEGGVLPRITLLRCEDGEVQVKDGHHRLVAYWLAGREELDRDEYLLLEWEKNRPRFGKIGELLSRVGCLDEHGS